MSWVTDVIGGMGRITKLVNNLELQFKAQDEEIKLLRRDNADLRKEVAAMAERLARVEESRNSTVSEVKRALSEALSDFQIKALREENEALKQRNITSS